MKRKQKNETPAIQTQLRLGNTHPFGALRQYVPMGGGEAQVYRDLREALPILDGAVHMASALASGLGQGIPPLSSVAGECSYDGAGDFFTKRLTVSMTVDLGSQGASLRSPAVLKNGTATAALVTQWKAEAKQTAEPVYGFGVAEPVGTVTGRRYYELELLGLLPQNGQKPEGLTEFSLELPGVATYTGCTWRSFIREETSEGTALSGKALARGRQEG